MPESPVRRSSMSSWRRRAQLIAGAAAATASAIFLGTALAAEEPLTIPDLSQDPAYQQANEIALAQEAARAARRDEPAEIEARQESKSSFADLDQAEAQALAQARFPDIFDRRTWTKLRVPDGMEVLRYQGRTAAVIGPDGTPSPSADPSSEELAEIKPGSLIESSLPIRAPEAGDLRPINPNLDDQGTYVEPTNAAVEAEIPDDLADGIDLPEIGISLHPHAMGDVSNARQVGPDKLFYANVDTDTDYVVTSTQVGVETFYVLRSAQSPEGLHTAVSVPEGESVGPDDSGLGLLVDGPGPPTASITPPIAVDADGTQVPTQIRPVGNGYTIDVDHRDGDFKYPILLDPTVQSYAWTGSNQSSCPTGTSGHWLAAKGGSDTAYWSTPSCLGNLGLINATTNTPHNYSANSNELWLWTAPSDSFIERVDLTGVAHLAQTTCTVLGIYAVSGSTWSQQAGNSADATRCSNIASTTKSYTVGSSDSYPAGSDAHGSDNNFFLMQLVMPTAGTRSSQAWNLISGATFKLYDQYAPTFTSPPSSSGWVDDSSSPTHSKTLSSSDRGLGAYIYWLSYPDKDEPNESELAFDVRSCDLTIEGTNPCSTAGTYAKPFSYQLPEGESTLTATVFDVLLQTATHSWVERIDRTAPHLSDPVGQFVDEAEAVDPAVTYDLDVAASDGAASGDPWGRQSGVTAIKAYVDDETSPVATETQTCSLPTTSCPMDETLEIHGSGLGDEGEHVLHVTAVDAVGHETPRGGADIPYEVFDPSLNHQPRDITLSADSVDEGLPSGTVVGSLSTDDRDDGDSFTYSLVGGTGDADNSSFEIDGDHLVTAESFDYMTDASFSVRIRSDDGNGGSFERQFGITINAPEPPPLEPSELDETEPTSTYEATQFLYEGSDPVQAGTDPGAIESDRAAVIRGHIADEGGHDLEGAIITAPDHPEYGTTLSREDGSFYFAVNGGGPILLQYEHEGFATAQREETIPLSDYELFDDVVLARLEDVHKEIELDGGASDAQVLTSQTITDSDGERTQTLIFPPGEEAEMQLPDGASQPIDTGTVRATEYTTGADGLQTMPGELPPSSDYTYAVEYSIDQAVDSDAESVSFSEPVVGYLDNFLDFDVGEAVPVGSYDYQRGLWVPEADGLVVKVLPPSGGKARLDIDGSGTAASTSELNDLGVSDAELSMVAELYDAGDELWRTPQEHFSPHDYNYPDVAPSDAQRPEGDISPNDPNAECTAPGSTIYCESQSLGETIPLVGTGLTLNYRSDRTAARAALLDVPLPSSAVTTSLKRVEITVSVAGVQHTETIQKADYAAAGGHYRFRWNRKDAFGRDVIGPQEATVLITYVYTSAGYAGAAPGVSKSFGSTNATPMTSNTRSGEYEISNQYAKIVGTWQPRQAGLGDWTLSEHNAYDPVSRTIYFGDGSRRRIAPRSVTTTAGGGPNSGDPGEGDGGPATAANLADPQGMDIGPDGSIYVADWHHDRVKRIAPDGTISTFAGSDNSGGSYDPGEHFAGDGGPATASILEGPRDVAAAPDGSVYILDQGNWRIRKVDPDGTIETVAGDGDFPIDDGPALQAGFRDLKWMDLGPDGNLYLADGSLIRKLTPDGRVTTIAGQGSSLTTPSAGGSIPAARLFISDSRGIAVAEDGTVYVASQHTYSSPHVPYVYAISPQGRAFLVAGSGSGGGSGDGGPAIDANFTAINGLDIDADGNIVVTDDNRLRRIRPDGIIEQFAGDPGSSTGFSSPDDEGQPPARVSLGKPNDVLSGPDGAIYVTTFENRLLRIGDSYPRPEGGLIDIPSEDGSEMFEFTEAGRHLRTMDALTGESLYEFGYDDGLLTSVTDADGNEVEIARDASGVPTSILAPFGQQTDLSLNGAGRLAEVENPAGESYEMTYNAGQIGTFTNPRNKTSTFGYDSDGLLISDENDAGRSTTLSRTSSNRGYEVTLHSAQGRTQKVGIRQQEDGDVKRTSVNPAGLVTTHLSDDNGASNSLELPDGTEIESEKAGDPRLGLNAPYNSKTTITAPSGREMVVEGGREANLADPADPFSFTSWEESFSVNGEDPSVVEYDPASNTVTATSSEGRSVATELDDAGRPVTAEVPGLEEFGYSYDAQGQLTGATQGAKEWSYDYDNGGNLSSTTDPLGRTQAYEYDEAGRLTEQTMPDNRVITYDYDANGNLTSVTPPGRQAHSLSHDAADRLSSYSPPSLGGGGEATTYTYEADGPIKSVDLPGGSAPADIQFGYDSDSGRLESITDDSGASTLAYDPGTGQLESASAPGSVGSEFSYDGMLVTGSEATGPAAGDVALDYDSAFRVDEIEVNATNPLALGYDQDGLLTSVGDLELQRSPGTGQVHGEELGTINAQLTRDGYGDVTAAEFEQGGSALYSAEFNRDVSGRITSFAEDDGFGTEDWGYNYDDAGRLVDVDLNGADYAEYSYDSNGNRETVTVGGSGPISATYDAQDRMTDRGVWDYEYGADGSLQSKTNNSNSAQTQYDYDSLGNLDTVTLPNGDDLDYLTDAFGRRVGKSVNGSLVQGFLYAPTAQGPMAELDGQGNVRSQFVYGTSRIVPDYMIKNGTSYLIIKNELGSPELVVNGATGTVVQRLDYGPFGEVLSDSNPGFQPFGFAGGIYDTDTGLTRFGARDYDSESGRWTAKDPIVFAGGQANLYGYVLNDPVNLIDPAGLSIVPGLDLGPLDDVTGTAGRTIGEFDDVITNGDAWAYGQNEALGVFHTWSLGALDAPCPGPGYGTGEALGATVGIEAVGALGLTGGGAIGAGILSSTRGLSVSAIRNLAKDYVRAGQRSVYLRSIQAAENHDVIKGIYDVASQYGGMLFK